MRKTDYLIGIHGEGLSLTIIMPTKIILHEILHKGNNKEPIVMSSLTGHKIYSDILKSRSKILQDNEFIFFDIFKAIKSVLEHI